MIVQLMLGALIKLTSKVPAKVNLIPFNPWPGAPFERSTPGAIRDFSDIIFDAGYSSPVRTPRGEDIMAACGQLKSDSVKQRRSVRDQAGRDQTEQDKITPDKIAAGEAA